MQVKSELLWPAHVLGKQHKEKVAELKGGKSQPVTPQFQPVKRKAPDNEDVNGKKAKPSSDAGQSASSGLPGDFFVKPSDMGASSTQKSAGLSLLAEGYDEDDDEVDA